MKRFLVLSGLSLLFGCGGSGNPSGNNPPDGGTDGGLAACVDRPTDLSRPPSSGILPCDLVPPR